MEENREIYAPADQGAFWRERLQDLADEASLQKDPLAAALLHHERGYILHRWLRDPEGALEAYRQARAREPELLPNLRALHQALEERGHLQELVDLLQHEAKASPNPAHRIELLWEFGLLNEALELRDKALRSYSFVLEREPQHLPSLRGRLRLQLASQSYKDLPETCEALAQVVQHPVVSGFYLGRLAVYLDRAKGDPLEVSQILKQAFELDPRNRLAIFDLLVHAIRYKLDPDLILAWEAQASAARPDVASASLVMAARVTWLRQADPQGALDLVSRAAKLYPSPASLTMALALSQLVGQADQAVPLLEQIAGWSPSPVIRSSLLAEAAWCLYSQEDRRAEALAEALRALRVLPSHPLALEVVKRAAPTLLGDEVGDALTADALATGDRAWRGEKLCEAGRLLERGGRALEAEELYRKALEDGCEPTLIIQGLARICATQGRWEESAAILQGSLGSQASAQGRQLILARISQIWGNEVGDLAKARESLEAALAEGPASGMLQAQMVRLSLQARDWARASASLEEQARGTRDPEARAGLLLRASRLARSSSSQGDRAMDLVRQAIQESPDAALGASVGLLPLGVDPVALGEILGLEAEAAQDKGYRTALLALQGSLLASGQPERALEALERAVEACPDDLIALGRLMVLCARLGRAERVGPMLEQGAERSQDRTEAAALLVRAAVAFEAGLGDRERALGALRRALALRPGSRTAMDMLLYLETLAGHWEGVAQLLRDILKGDQGQRAMAIWARLGQVSELRLDDPEAALESYQRALEGSEEPHYHPLAMLEGVGRMAGRLGKRADQAAARQALGLAIDDDITAAALLVQGGMIWEFFCRERVKALECYRAALERVESHREALEGVVRILSRAGPSEELGEALEVLAERFTGAARATWLLEAASVWTFLPNWERALLALREAGEALPGSVAVLMELEVVYQALGRSQERADILDELCPLAQSRELRAALHLRAAEVHSRDLHSNGMAREHLKALLELEPDSPQAYRLMRQILTQEKRWGDLAELYEQRAGRAGEEERVEVLRRLALLRRDSLGDIRRAIGTLKQLLALRPRDMEALMNLADLCAKDQQWHRALEAYEGVVVMALEPKMRVKALHRAGVILEERMKDLVGAAHCYVLALEATNDHVPSLTRLHEIYRKAKDWPQVAEVLRLWIRAEPDWARKRDLMLSLAWLMESDLQDEAAALRYYQMVLDADPANVSAIQALSRRLLHSGDRESLKNHLELAVESVRNHIALDPFNGEGYRQLYHLLEQQGIEERLYPILDILAMLDLATEKDAHFLASYRSRMPMRPRGVLGPKEMALLAPQGDEAGYRRLCRALEPALGAVYGIDLSRHGVSRQDRLSRKSQAPERRLAEAVGEAMGVEDFDLFLAGGPLVTEVELTTPPSLILGRDLLQGQNEPFARFYLGRIFYRLAAGEAALFKMDQRGLRQLARAVSSLGRPAGGEYKDVESLAKRVQKALGRQRLEAMLEDLDPLLESLAGAPDPKPYMALANKAANRAGLLICGEIRYAVSAVKSDLERQGRAGGRKADEISDLLSFWVSTEATGLRRSLGLAPDSTDRLSR